MANTKITSDNLDTLTTLTVDNITIDGQEIDVSSGDLTLDVAADIILDAGGNEIKLKTAGTEWGQIYNSSSDLAIYSSVQDKDIKLQGNDGGSVITALTLDMSDAGRAIFNAGANFGTTSSSTYAVQIQANTGGNALQLKGRNAAENAGWLVWTDFSGNAEAGIYATADNLIFANTTSYTERMRILPNGTLLVGKTADNNTVGFKTNTSSSYMVSSCETPFFINRF